MPQFFIGLLSVLLGIISVLIVLIVLMQRPKQEGLGAAFGGGMTDQMFGAQTTNVLQKGTVYLAVMFFAFSLIISVLTAKSVRDDTKSVEELKNEAAPTSLEDPILTPGLTPGVTPGATGTTPPIKIETPPIDPDKVTDPVGDAEPTTETEPTTEEPTTEEPAPAGGTE